LRVKNSETEISRCLVASVSAETRGALDVLAAGFEVSFVWGSVLTSFSDVCLRRSLALSGSSICADCPLTTRSDRFAVPAFLEAARVERATALGDLDPARDLELSLRFDLLPKFPPLIHDLFGFTSVVRESALPS
jgi:hypothetical protein